MGGNSAGVEEEASGVGEGCGDVVGEPEEKVLGEGEEDGMSLGKEEPVDGEEMTEEGQVCGSQEEEVKSTSSVDMVSGFKEGKIGSERESVEATSDVSGVVLKG